jgi:lipoyl(octanoyl) transferase
VAAAVREWGRREYGAALSEMRALRAARRRGEIDDTLILVEHPAVITVGVQGAEGDLLPEGIPVVAVERGGRSTYHGPGQLVAYPIVDLDRRGRDVRRFVRDVEELAIRGAAELGVEAARRPEHRGVWVGGERKIASVGIAVEEWVTFHGLAVNVATDLEVFRSFRPCGLPGDVMTSLSRELGRPVAVGELTAPIVRAWTELFGGSPVAAPGPADTRAGPLPAVP